MDRQPTLESERLLLRPLAPRDWDALFAVASDPQIWAVHPAQDRWQEPVFRKFFDDALSNGGAMAAIDKANGNIIGSSRWQAHSPDNGGEVEIGWTFLARPYWGRGYNAEMKRLMLAHALQWVERVKFRVGVDNTISRRAMEKIGGKLTDQLDVTRLAGQDVVHVIYVIDREAFAGGPLSLG